MKAQERHQLKENEFAKTVSSVADLVQGHRNQVALVLGIVVVVAAAVGGWAYFRTQKANEAGALLGIATAMSQAPITPAPRLPGASQTPGTFPTEQARTEATIKAYQQVVSSFPGTDAATVASYQLGSELLLAQRPAEAEQAFHTVVSSGSAFYASLARLGEAQALMAQNKYDEALKIYTDLAADRSGPLPTDALLMEQARAAQKAGKPQDARALFKRVVDEFPDSGYVADAKAQLAALK
jgi:TolA-binding protein